MSIKKIENKFNAKLMDTCNFKLIKYFTKYKKEIVRALEGADNMLTKQESEILELKAQIEALTKPHVKESFLNKMDERISQLGKKSEEAHLNGDIEYSWKLNTAKVEMEKLYREFE